MPRRQRLALVVQSNQRICRAFSEPIIPNVCNSHTATTSTTTKFNNCLTVWPTVERVCSGLISCDQFGATDCCNIPVPLATRSRITTGDLCDSVLIYVSLIR